MYVASWKAYLTFKQAQDFVKKNKEALATLGKDYQLIICPSFDALATLSPELKNLGIALGAQDCSAHNPGPFTGQVLAASLKEIGCSYCIIGHSEVRKECQETTATIGAKAIQLLNHGIIPIICVGESAKEYDINIGIQAIEQQLEPILISIKTQKPSLKGIAIGYEPVWAIGDGSTPSTEYLTKQLELIKRLCTQHLPEYQALLFYGGGVNDINILKFKNIPLLDGIMIGGASTDFQKLQKIVLS